MPDHGPVAQILHLDVFHFERSTDFVLSRPGERVLMLIGAGHAPILRQLLEYAPGVRLIESSKYLSETIRGNT